MLLASSVSCRGARGESAVLRAWHGFAQSLHALLTMLAVSSRGRAVTPPLLAGLPSAAASVGFVDSAAFLPGHRGRLGRVVLSFKLSPSLGRLARCLLRTHFSHSRVVSTSRGITSSLLRHPPSFSPPRPRALLRGDVYRVLCVVCVVVPGFAWHARTFMQARSALPRGSRVCAALPLSPLVEAGPRVTASADNGVAGQSRRGPGLSRPVAAASCTVWSHRGAVPRTLSCLLLSWHSGHTAYSQASRLLAVAERVGCCLPSKGHQLIVARERCANSQRRRVSSPCCPRHAKVSFAVMGSAGQVCSSRR